MNRHADTHRLHAAVHTTNTEAWRIYTPLDVHTVFMRLYAWLKAPNTGLIYGTNISQWTGIPSKTYLTPNQSCALSVSEDSPARSCGTLRRIQVRSLFLFLLFVTFKGTVPDLKGILLVLFCVTDLGCLVTTHRFLLSIEIQLHVNTGRNEVYESGTTSVLSCSMAT